MLVDLAQPAHAHTDAKLVQHSHVGHLVLPAQASELSPRALFRQHLDQQIQGPHRRKQTQQVHAKELGGGVRPPPSAGGAVRPTGVDEIVGDEGIQKFEQRGCAGRGQVGVHARQPIAETLTRQRQRPAP
jgi:hypothetical protein